VGEGDSTGDGDKVWIGVYRKGMNAVSDWCYKDAQPTSSCTAQTYTSWASGEGQNTGEKCVLIGDNGNWTDDTCGDTNWFCCHRPYSCTT
jgi:hypothetical protein